MCCHSVHYRGVFSSAVVQMDRTIKGGPRHFAHDRNQCMLILFSVQSSPILFMGVGANTVLLPDLIRHLCNLDCVEYGEWKTGLRNDRFQYAFISLGIKSAWLGTFSSGSHSCAKRICGKSTAECGGAGCYETFFYYNTRCVLWWWPELYWFYRLNKRYNEIVEEINARKSVSDFSCSADGTLHKG